MVLLTFTGMKKDLLSRLKLQTTRWNLARWYKVCGRYPEGRAKLDIWWQNPRTCKPDCYKMGIAYVTKLEGKYGKYFNSRDAYLDGFNSLKDYINGLKETNHLPDKETVLEHEWAILTWKWDDGPHQPPVKKHFSLHI